MCSGCLTSALIEGAETKEETKLFAASLPVSCSPSVLTTLGDSLCVNMTVNSGGNSDGGSCTPMNMCTYTHTEDKYCLEGFTKNPNRHTKNISVYAKQITWV